MMVLKKKIKVPKYNTAHFYVKHTLICYHDHTIKVRCMKALTKFEVKCGMYGHLLIPGGLCVHSIIAFLCLFIVWSKASAEP